MNNSFGNKLTRAGLYLFAVSLPISHVPAQWGIGLALLGWIVEGVLKKRWRMFWHPFVGVLVFYLAWNALAALLSPRPLHSLNAVGDNEWPFLIMLMIFWTINDASFLRRMVQLYFGTAAIAMLYAIWQTFGGMELYRKAALDWMGGYYRAVGFYGFYLTFAAFAMSVFFLSSAFALESKKNRILHLLLAFMSFCAIIGSFARSIWLSLGIGIPMIGFLKNRKLGIVLSVCLIVLAAVVILGEPTIRSRAASIVELEQNQTRLNLWKTSFEIFRSHPLLGVGEDNFDHFFPIHRVEGYYDTTVHPHSDYLSVLVASGVPGLLTFLSMWGIALRTGIKTWKESIDPDVKAIALGASLSLVGFLVGGFFQNYYGTFINCLGWWFLAGLIFSSFRITQLQNSASIHSSS
ncbi:MAG: O-antigen ligase family protein [Bacteroidota bacterium]